MLRKRPGSCKTRAFLFLAVFSVGEFGFLRGGWSSPRNSRERYDTCRGKNKTTPSFFSVNRVKFEWKQITNLIPLNRKTSSKRGRPAKDLLARLRVMIWSRHVMAASGMEQVAQFEKLLLTLQPPIRLSSGLWPRYLRGDVLPQGSLEGHKSSLLNRLDKAFPGTGSIFFHPVWELLDFDRILSPRELQGHYRALGEAAHAKLTHLPTVLKTLPANAKVFFWRSPRSDSTRQSVWSSLTDLDGVAVCLLEARLDYLAQREDGFVQAMSGAGSEFARLASKPMFHDNKAKSALLIMELMAWRYAACLASEDSLLREHRGDLCLTVAYWGKSLEARAQAHQERLWGPENSTFLRWFNQVKSREYLG